MKQELENRAKQIFREKYQEQYKKGLEAWIGLNQLAYWTVIIPSIVQGLMEVPNSWNKCDCEIPKPVDPFDNPATCRDCNGYIPAESVSAENAQVQVAENSSDTESKIKSGQKLRHGDWFSGNTEQIIQILNTYSNCFEADQMALYMRSKTVIFFHWTSASGLQSGETRDCIKKTKHSFSDFLQLCKNTFQ